MGEQVRAKKHLGQHFLKDENIAANIVESLKPEGKYKKVLEIGPGMGVLTKYLIQRKDIETSVIDIDRESIAFLEQNFPDLKDHIVSADFLKYDLDSFSSEPFAIIGNFPYNISSQILFKVLDYRDKVPEVVGMFQKEVAERVASVPRKKAYGIMSVLLQAFYNIEYLFTVHEHVFSPPPKVKSAVIRLTRNTTTNLGCDEKLFIQLVKTGFNQRRKTLRNALKSLHGVDLAESRFVNSRAEELSVTDFVELTNFVQKS